MAFSAEVRTRALVAAARHCGVCHRYKGVKVEVHHIVPQAEGGSDEFENAIPLCFDCHADAGHYNTRHPRGAKFSREELERARDAWFALVAGHGIGVPETPDRLYCRYLVCKDFGALLEIGRGDLSRVPLSGVHLVENAVLDFLVSVLRSHRETYRHARAWGDSYRTEEEFFREHPDAVRTDRREVAFPYFETVRIPTSTELWERAATDDGVTRLLLESDVASEQIARVVGFFEPCGAGSFQEMYRLRPLWGVFLAATNIATEPVRLAAIAGHVDQPMSLAMRPLEEIAGSTEIEVPLPAASIPVGATVLIPVATVLAPLENVGGEEGARNERELSSGQWQTFAHMRYSPENLEECRLIGASIWPHGLRIESGEERRFQEVHELDLRNLYVLDRGWSAGSCPHLFVREGAQRKLRYKGELFSRTPGKRTVEIVEIPSGVSEIVIAELEREVTHIESVRAGSSVVVEAITLRQGDVIRLSVGEGQSVTITGWYVPGEQTNEEVWQRNELVARFLTTEELPIGTAWRAV